MAILLSYLKVPLTWREVFRRTFTEAFWKDNCFGMAAQLAYYFFFALFPALLVLIAVASYFPLDQLVDDIVRTLGEFAPPDVLTIVTEQIHKISEDRQGGLLTIGMLAALWTTSTAMTAVIGTLNSAYGIEESRPFWKVRVIAVTLTIGVALFILVSFALVLLGPTLAERAAARLYLGEEVEWALKILQWPLVFVLASVGIAIIYYFAPDADQDWVWLTPGSIFATTLWILASLGFKYYVVNMGNYTETYGAIGGVMVLLLWFYISGLVILVGAEMNAEIEHASPHGKDEGEKVPGERRVIGPAAMRAWIARRRQHGEPAPGPEEIKDVKETVESTAARGSLPAAAPMDSNRRGPSSTPAQPFSPTARTPPASAGARPLETPRARPLLDWLIGAPLVAAQVWWALRSYRTRVRS